MEEKSAEDQKFQNNTESAQVQKTDGVEEELDDEQK